jgi:hypothetical protein
VDEPLRRRRRVRHEPDPAAETSATQTVAITAEVADEAPEPVENGDAETTPAERGLRGLVGGGSSQVSPAAALRARDAARPSEQDLDRAESELTIVRRHWTPRD